jgi:hypothetical protein
MKRVKLAYLVFKIREMWEWDAPMVIALRAMGVWWPWVPR